MYRSLADAVRDAQAQGKTLSLLALETESRDQGRPIEEIRGALRRALEVMRGAVERGLEGDLRSASGLVGGDGECNSRECHLDRGERYRRSRRVPKHARQLDESSEWIAHEAERSLLRERDGVRHLDR